MKTNFKNKLLPIVAFCALSIACTKEDEYEIQEFTPSLFAEEFSKDAVDNTVLDTEGWMNYAEAGTVKWKEQVYSGNAYAEFTPFGAIPGGQPSTIGWLISPSINMDEHENEQFSFLSAQAYVDNAANTLEVLVSKDFNGIDVLAATWEPLTFNQPLSGYDNNFDFFRSGTIDFSKYEGNIHVAFRVVGNSSSLDGTYQIDNVRITY